MNLRLLRRLLAPAALAVFAAGAVPVAGCSDPTVTAEPHGSTSAKTSGSNAPVVATPEIPGLDTTTLTPNEKKELYSDLASTLAPCPSVPVNLTQCITEKRDCKACVSGANFLLKQVRAGRSKSDREKAFAIRFDPKNEKEVVVGDAPFRGPAEAVVTIVEWADFECPVCKGYAPLLDALVERFPGQVRLVYKLYPLPMHPNGAIAARASVAALAQGKFWEMHDLLFLNQEHNDRTGVERLARKLKLDMPKFKADLVDDETANRIERDKKEAEVLGLEGTPFIYIGKREFNLEILSDPPADLEEWVKTEIELAGQTPNPPSKNWVDPLATPPGGEPAPLPSGSASAEPSAAPSPAPSAAPAPSASAKPK